MSDYLHPDDARGDWVDHECSQGGSNTKAEARWDAMIAKIKADALKEAADEWLRGAWADTPRHAERVQERMAASQYAGEWFKAVADRIEAGNE